MSIQNSGRSASVQSVAPSSLAAITMCSCSVMRMSTGVVAGAHFMEPGSLLARSSEHDVPCLGSPGGAGNVIFVRTRQRSVVAAHVHPELRQVRVSAIRRAVVVGGDHYVLLLGDAHVHRRRRGRPLHGARIFAREVQRARRTLLGLPGRCERVGRRPASERGRRFLLGGCAARWLVLILVGLLRRERGGGMSAGAAGN